MQYVFLDKIKSPLDLKKLNSSEISRLCDEIRDLIINTVSKNGGHLASNLGAVELTVALHRAFNAPEDAIIFDVGHQCYTHKLLTGRYPDFDTLRQKGGLSGFMRPSESIYDPFVTGHSSNSVSAAYGIYKAKAIKGESGTAVAVIGDGALTGGMAYEALNNAGSGRNNFIVVLNDNKMSISRNVGALARSLTKMRNKPKYHYFKFAVSDILNKIPFIGKHLVNFIFTVKETFKSAIYKDNFFKSLGFNYLGPVDGHDIKAMEELFKVAKSYVRPSVVHVVTVKGKGYSFAENSPKSYHGVNPFDVDEGKCESMGETFSSVAGKTLTEMADTDCRICAVTAAMTEGTGLISFREKHKNRFFDVGIAEQHAVTFSAGLASGGMRPYFAVYSSFLQRAYDQIMHDSAIANLPITLLIDRAGIVGADGESHQGLYDVSFLRSIPNINIYSPTAFNELAYRIKSSADKTELSAIRYPKGGQAADYDFDFKADYAFFDGNSENIAVTYGREFDCVYAAALRGGFSVLKLNKVYPLPDITEKLLKFKRICFFEESVRSGGIAELLGNALALSGFSGEYKIYSVNDEFVGASEYREVLKDYNLDTQSVISAFM